MKSAEATPDLGSARKMATSLMHRLQAHNKRLVGMAAAVSGDSKATESEMDPRDLCSTLKECIRLMEAATGTAAVVARRLGAGE